MPVGLEVATTIGLEERDHDGIVVHPIELNKGYFSFFIGDRLPPKVNNSYLAASRELTTKSLGLRTIMCIAMPSARLEGRGIAMQLIREKNVNERNNSAVRQTGGLANTEPCEHALATGAGAVVGGAVFGVAGGAAAGAAVHGMTGPVGAAIGAFLGAGAGAMAGKCIVGPVGSVPCITGKTRWTVDRIP